MKSILRLLSIIIVLGCFTSLKAQDKLVLSGSIQLDALVPETDSVIGAIEDYDSPFLSNTYVDLGLRNSYLAAGLRFEYLQYPLPGFVNDQNKDFDGYGFPHLYFIYTAKKIEVTVGDFYDQFGSGFILRSYEDRPLGIDNSLRGARIVFNPMNGLRIKALAGNQRVNFSKLNSNKLYGLNYDEGFVMGTDIEMDIHEFIPQLKKNDWNVLFGLSGVSKFEPKEDLSYSKDLNYLLNFPKFVASTDARLRIQKGNYTLLTEYAYKNNDPSADNGFSYNSGSAAMISASYSKRGMSLLFQAKRSENMVSRSQRLRSGSAAMVNHLPAFTLTQTYALASLYPYATQGLGEWAFQGEARYTFKRKSLLGGHYGTKLRANLSVVRGIRDFSDMVELKGGSFAGTDAPKTKFFDMGDETYYTDFNLMLSKKVNKSFAFTALYMYQEYNQKVVEGEGHNGDIVKSHIGVAELKYHFTKKTGLRTELQYLHTEQDLGDWAFVLCELSLFGNLMLEVSDMYNLDETNTHYYRAGATYNFKAHRLQLAYGRTRAGYNCSGGVCRVVPASKGLSLSYIYTF